MLAEAVAAWYAEVADAYWSGKWDVSRRYPLAAFGYGGRVAFDLGHANYCAVVRVNFGLRVVLIEFIGPRSAVGDIPKGKAGKSSSA